MAKEITRVVVGPIQCNCYVLTDTISKKAYLIDPGAESKELMIYLDRSRLDLQGILITHAHIDHIGGIEMVQQKFAAPIYYHNGDHVLYRNIALQAESFGFSLNDLMARQPGEGIDVQDNQQFPFGESNVLAIHTPGHTPGSTCYYTDGEDPVLFSGDTLFEGTIGRTDLWGGSFPQIIESIRTRLLTLPDGVRVLPGHGSATTIGDERSQNPFLQNS